MRSEAEDGVGSLADLVGGGAPDEVVVHTVQAGGGARPCTREPLLAIVDAYAADLRAAGVRPGHAVAVALPNDESAIAALFAVWRAGAVHVPVNPLLTVPETARIVEAARPAAALTVPDLAARFPTLPVVLTDGAPTDPGAVGTGRADAPAVSPSSSAAPASPAAASPAAASPAAASPAPGSAASGTGISGSAATGSAATGSAATGTAATGTAATGTAVTGTAAAGGASRRGPAADGTGEAAVYDADIALVQTTSGTTGRPKPVLLRHSGVLELLDGVIDTLRPGGGSDRARAPMPNLIPVSLSLWAGIYQVLFAFRVGAPAVVMPRFETGPFQAAVKQFGIRSVVLPPAAMTMLADDTAITDLAPLRYVRSITAPLSPLAARRFRDRFGIAVMNCYGQTEIGGEIIGWSAADLKQHADDKLGAVGRPHRGVTVRAAAENDGAPLPEGDVGELQVRTPALSAGYADGRDFGDRLTADGWFRTGDVGRVDAEGFVWIEGRVSDVINRGGLKVFPAEVAEVLRLDPRVADAAVVGVSDPRLGEVPWAFVVPAAGAPPPDADDLRTLCREHIAPYKIPVTFEPIAGLPRNEVGKVRTADLIARATGAHS